MSRRWLVDFIDAGNCEIASIEVTCYRPYNAPKVAFKKLADDHVKLSEQVDKECTRIRVSDAK